MVLRSLSKVIIVVSRCGSVTGGVLLVGAVGIVTVSAIGRYVFGSPIAGATEALGFALAPLVFLALAEVGRQGRHLRVTILSDRFPPGVQLLLDCGFNVLAIGMMVILAWGTTEYAYASWSSKTISTVVHIPFWVIASFIAVGAAWATLTFLASLFRDVRELVTNRHLSFLWIILVFAASLLILVAPLALKLLPWEIDKLAVGVVGLLFMLLLVFLGSPIAIAMLIVGYVGTSYCLSVHNGLNMTALVTFMTATKYDWVVIPYFIFMGLLVYYAELSRDIYSTAHKWLGHYPGGLAMATVVGCAGFAAACGDSLCTALTMGKVALPEMRRYKYDPKLATGTVAAGGTLCILIPPSLGFIVYAIITDVSIGKLFMAGILPGIMLATLFCILIYIRIRLNPSLAERGPNTSLREKLISLKGTVGILALFMLIIGGIYLGLFTPSEAGGIGCFGAVLMGLIMKRWNRENFIASISEAVIMTSALYLILIAAMVLSFFLTISNVPLVLSNLITELPWDKWAIFGIVLLTYIILGCVMNIMPAMLITLPIIFPTILALGFDPVWFGVIMVITMEMGQITPPIGINVYGIASVAPDVPMGSIFKGILPFFLMMLLAIGILVLFPDIATILPNTM